MNRIPLTFVLGLALIVFSTVHAAEYVAHEWGTFTSVQGTDGVLLEWRPLATSELPDFVYNRTKNSTRQQPPGFGPVNKYEVASTQRMETPVLYFYPTEEMTVDVSVKFPQGAITEWYPMVRSIGPQGIIDPKVLKDGVLDWGKVRLFPAEMYPEFAKDLPAANSGTNYFAARETDAAIVRVGTTRGPVHYEHEKFLFYRGVGSFKAPVEVQGGGDHGIRVTNHDAAAIPAFFVLTVGENTASFTSGGNLEPAAVKNVPAGNPVAKTTPEETADALSVEMQAALLKQGLYAREAAAMVKTWRDSWFLEKGTRILYILPDSWTERTLPLTLAPAPKELKRVMVGRAELITRQMETDVAQQIAALSSTDFETREKATKTLTGLGRFAEPSLLRVVNTTDDAEVKSRATKLIEELHASVK